MSVKVFRINIEEVMERLRRWALELAQDDNVLAVVLFGSLAKGEATPASDADILILLRESKKRFTDRIPNFLPERIGISSDIFPYTIDEFRALLRENRGMAKEISENGIALYQKVSNLFSDSCLLAITQAVISRDEEGRK